MLIMLVWDDLFLRWQVVVDPVLVPFTRRYFNVAIQNLSGAIFVRSPLFNAIPPQQASVLT
jgi:hypothetical protein